jgi:hypothetical protein
VFEKPVSVIRHTATEGKSPQRAPEKGYDSRWSDTKVHRGYIDLPQEPE